MDKNWDSRDLAAEFEGVSTPDMIRVARMVTPHAEAYSWVVTQPGRTWTFADGDWTSANDLEDERPCEFDEDFFRFLLGEQLVAQGVNRTSPVWQRY